MFISLINNTNICRKYTLNTAHTCLSIFQKTFKKRDIYIDYKLFTAAHRTHFFVKLVRKMHYLKTLYMKQQASVVTLSPQQQDFMAWLCNKFIIIGDTKEFQSGYITGNMIPNLQSVLCSQTEWTNMWLEHHGAHTSTGNMFCKMWFPLFGWGQCRNAS